MAADAEHRNADEKKSLRAGLWRWGRRADRARSAWSWWGWLTAGGASNAAVGLGSMAVVGATGVWVANDTVRTAWGIPGPVVVRSVTMANQQALGEDAVLYQVAGADSSGLKATFDLIVLGRDTVWVKGSTEQISRGGTTLAADAFKSMLAGGALGKRVAAARELIAIGVASREGDQSSEEARAGERARRIGGWLVQADSTQKPIWSLNLGQHRGDCGGCDTAVTDWQRPIIVVGLTAADKGVNIGEALANAMSARANLPSPENYSRFVMARVR